MTVIDTPVEHQSASQLPIIEIPCDLDDCKGPARWTVTWAPSFRCPTCGLPPAIICDQHKQGLMSSSANHAMARCPCGYVRAPLRTVLKRVDPL